MDPTTRPVASCRDALRQLFERMRVTQDMTEAPAAWDVACQQHGLWRE